MRQKILNEVVNPYYRMVNPVLEAALTSVDPYECVQKSFELDHNLLKIGEKRVDLGEFAHIHLIGTGKAVLPMALAVKDRLGDRIDSGVLIGKHADESIQAKLSTNISFFLGSHPIPTQQSIDSTRQLVNFLNNVKERDLVICLISGGGSALMTLPYAPINLADMQETTRLLLASGATINEMNTVRKHLDQVKGGGLARLVAPAALITLVLSDVIGDDLDVIASGPTVADSSTFQDAWQVVTKHHLEKQLPAEVIGHIEKGLTGHVPETVKTSDSCLKKSTTQIIGSLRIAANAAARKANELGFKTEILSMALKGEAREKGIELAQQFRNRIEKKFPLKESMCLIAGGETTVTVRGDGMGGRNQETALSAAGVLKGLSDCLFISLATDGEDGPTDAAGGIVDGGTIENGIRLGLDADDYLNRNDAYYYLERTGCLLFTGPTGTNVNDLVLMFAFRER